MLRYLWVVAMVLLFLLASCESLPSEVLSTDSLNPQGASLTAAVSESSARPETTTPLIPKTPTEILTTVTPTPELPTHTPLPSTTVTPVGPTETPILTPTVRLLRKPTATQAFLAAQPGSPVGMQNFAHPELDCQWLGVAGQVFDIDDTPMMNLVVEFGGELANQPIFGLAITGQAETYGEGGYEFKLGDEPMASSGTVWAQVFDLEGNAVSSPIYFSTFDSCKQNLIILNFVQAYKLPTDWFYLPAIFKGGE
jgi:hypothetical protein